ncbi:MAG: GTPase ObgE [Candidatus Brocadiia bacterium]
MHFVDEAEIYVKAGDGGDGRASFRREKYVPKGGPSGGDGGEGGDIIIKANENMGTLLDLVSRKQYLAGDGEDGKTKKRDGADGEDVVIEVPVGTVIRDIDTDLVLKDLTEEGQSVVVAEGGQGGRGNVHFATSTNQAPTEYEEGTEGEERNLRLELKLIADVGLVGKPNAGKSTLLSRISAAHPRIASYPFTTLEPQLGIVDTEAYRRFTVADLPGLIQGAHNGRGLGDEFLKHIERTRILVHLVDIVPLDESDPVENYHSIRDELKLYSEKLAKTPEIVAANKIDLPGANQGVERLREELDCEVIPVSATRGDGLKQLIGEILNSLQKVEELREAEETGPPKL